MLETQIHQISTAIPSQSNEDSSKTPIQESVRSIFTVSGEKATKPTEGSLEGVGKDKKPSTAENFFAEIFLTCQECHICCNKLSSHAGDLNIQVWRRSCSQT
jgi:hypothetical protein